jgi:hypothetical protein
VSGAILGRGDLGDPRRSRCQRRELRITRDAISAASNRVLGAKCAYLTAAGMPSRKVRMEHLLVVQGP